MCAFVSRDHVFSFSPLLKDIFPLIRDIKSIEYYTIGENITILLGMSVVTITFLGLIYSILVLYKLMFASLTRNVDTTIKENELIIISSILHHHGVILDEDIEFEAGEHYFVKGYDQ